jgi:ABC-type transport system involved in multi-copper enzyme maturation permease subunit
MWWLFRAEWKKMTGNRWLSGCLIWSWSIAALVISLALVILVAISSGARDRFADNPYQWTDAAVFFWAIPNSIIGRLLIIGFTASLFGGEYQWGTWKNLLLRQSRITLILVKFYTLAIFVLIAFGLTSLIWVIGMGLVQLVAGGSYPPSLGEIPSTFWREVVLQILAAFLSVLILAGVAALAALLTRSALGSVIVGVGFAIIDGFVAAGLMVFYLFTDWRFFPSLYRFTISYNVDNLLNWATSGRASPVLGNVRVQDNPVFGELVIDPPLAGNPLGISLLILCLWMAVLVGLAVVSFYRQDLST